MRFDRQLAARREANDLEGSPEAAGHWSSVTGDFWDRTLKRRLGRRGALALMARGTAATALLAACGGDAATEQRAVAREGGVARDSSVNTVRSRDGTLIAFDRLGSGPPVIQVAGALGVRAHPIMAELAGIIASQFTVYNYDRRGRGESTDTLPYAVQREVEDIEALIDEAGGSAYLYGLSSGAALVLDAANRLGGKVRKLALYEPPFIVDASRPPLPEDYVAQLNRMLAEGRRGDAVALFMTVVGVPEDFLAQMQAMPMWAELEKVAHTLPYDGTIMGDTMSGRPLPRERWAAVTSPALVIVGGASEPFFHNGTQALTDALPDARRRVLAGQSHEVDGKVLAPVLAEFFAG